MLLRLVCFHVSGVRGKVVSLADSRSNDAAVLH